jgi:hypothetical protein
VAKTEMWPEFCSILIVYKCCRLLLLLLCYYFYGHYCVLYGFFVLFVIKYFVVIEIPKFLE